MFKSVFYKYMAVFLVMIIVSFAALSIVVSSMFMQYTVDTKKEMMLRSSESILEYMYDNCGMVDKQSFTNAVNFEVDDLRSFVTQMTIFTDDVIYMIAFPDGTIPIYNSNVPSAYIADNIPIAVMDSLKETTGMTKVDLDGVFDQKHYCYATPYFGEDGTYLGALFVCSPSEGMEEMVDMVVRIIVMTSLWVMVISMVCVYFLTERSIAPLRNMTKASKKFAQGDFSTRIEVKGRDEIAQLSESFNNMAQQLDKLEDTRKTFLVNVAHDLRTPMTTIGGFVDAIRDGTIPVEKQDYYLTLISDEVKRLSRLVAQLLDVSRIEAGDRKFNFDNFDICEMGRMILISFESKLEEKKLDVEFDVESDNMYVYADKDAIHQVFYNICHNAIKFSYEGGKYRIRINRMDHKVYVSVYNEGVGMSEEDLPNVFDRFYKSDKSRGLDKTGVGMGMYITKTIINAHQQDIWVKSVFKEYCEFVFTLKEGSKPQAKPRITDK
ncbi:MAG: HAMP domain-containing histidine kinase [Clostridia bacterium]|nr:HAMP domain-containing histidine kinase [Clostridia bacterium]